MSAISEFRHRMEAIRIMWQAHGDADESNEDGAWHEYRMAVRDCGDWCSQFGDDLLKEFDDTAAENQRMRVQFGIAPEVKVV